MFDIPETVPQADLIALLGSLFAAQSIILVFEMFILQSWSDGTRSLADSAHEIDQTTAVGSLDRLSIAERIRKHRRGVPWIHLVVLSVAMVSLTTVAFLLSLSIDDLPWPYTSAPVIVLAIAFGGGTLGIVLSGLAALKDAASRVD